MPPLLASGYVLGWVSSVRRERAVTNVSSDAEKARPAACLVCMLCRKVVRRLLMPLSMFLLRLYPPDRLARVGREHHIEAVRRRAWLLSGAFIAGEGTYFNWHLSVVLERWGDLAATLGERVALAPGITFVAASGPCYSRLAQLEGFAERHIKYAPIAVGDDTWIGANATLLPGVTIGKCCLIGAGSVVTRDVPDYAIAAGIPARVIGDVREGGGTPPEGPAP